MHVESNILISNPKEIPLRIWFLTQPVHRLLMFLSLARTALNLSLRQSLGYIEVYKLYMADQLTHNTGTHVGCRAGSWTFLNSHFSQFFLVSMTICGCVMGILDTLLFMKLTLYTTR